MNNQPGWIKLYKQTLESDFWLSEDEPFDWRSAFIHVLLSANWRKGTSRKNGHMITIERGQLLTSIRKLMATFHWSRKRVENWIKGMTEYGMLESQSVGFGTVLTVVNYDKFQSDGAKVEHTVEHKVEHIPEHTVEHKVDPRSKNKDIRQQKEESIFAPPEQPAGREEDDDGIVWYDDPEEAMRNAIV
jgi:hypothetical protein